jgi:hypothetical protein
MSLAIRIQLSFKDVEERDLLRTGASVDEHGMWTFPDGSRGWILHRRVQVAEDRMGRAVWCYFESLDADSCKPGAHALINRVFTDGGEATMEQVCAGCGPI